MPRKKTASVVLTAAEIKAKKADLKQATKNTLETLKPYQISLKEAEKAVAAAKREADKAVAVAQKTAAAEMIKFNKAKAAADKGLEKINAQLASLEPVATTE